jgi:hypothetical protein
MPPGALLMSAGDAADDPVSSKSCKKSYPYCFPSAALFVETRPKNREHIVTSSRWSTLAIGISGFLDCENNALIGTKSQRFVHFLRIEAAAPQIALGANYKESGKEIHGIKPRKIYVSAIHGDDGIFFQWEDRGVHQMDVLWVDGVDNPVPLIIVQIIFLLETPGQVQRGKMTLNTPARQTFAKN